MWIKEMQRENQEAINNFEKIMEKDNVDRSLF